MSAHEVIRAAVNEHVKDAKQAAKISDSVFIALDNNGWFTTDSDHLAMMRTALQVVHSAVVDGETARKDISPLTRRLQDLSGLVTTLEERQRHEGGPKRGKSSTNGSADEQSFDPADL